MPVKTLQLQQHSRLDQRHGGQFTAAAEADGRTSMLSRVGEAADGRQGVV